MNMLSLHNWSRELSMVHIAYQKLVHWVSIPIAKIKKAINVSTLVFIHCKAKSNILFRTWHVLPPPLNPSHHVLPPPLNPSYHLSTKHCRKKNCGLNFIYCKWIGYSDDDDDNEQCTSDQESEKEECKVWEPELSSHILWRPFPPTTAAPCAERNMYCICITESNGIYSTWTMLNQQGWLHWCSICCRSVWIGIRP